MYTYIPITVRTTCVIVETNKISTLSVYCLHVPNTYFRPSFLYDSFNFCTSRMKQNYFAMMYVRKDILC